MPKAAVVARWHDVNPYTVSAWHRCVVPSSHPCVQERAALNVQLEQLHLRHDMQQTENKAQIASLKQALAALNEEKAVLARSNTAKGQQLGSLSALACSKQGAAEEAQAATQQLRELEQRATAEVCTLPLVRRLCLAWMLLFLLGAPPRAMIVNVGCFLVENRLG